PLGDTAIVEHDATLVGTIDCVGAVDDDGARPAGSGRGNVEEIVAAVDLGKLRAFAFKAALVGAEDGVDAFDKDSVHAAWLDSGEIGFHLDERNATASVNHINATVVV